MPGTEAQLEGLTEVQEDVSFSANTLISARRLKHRSEN